MPEWLQNPYMVFGLAIGAMFFGYFFGLFEGRGQGYKRRQAEEAGKSEPEAEAGEVSPLASPPSAPDEPSMLNVSMDNDGHLRLKLDGNRVEASAIDAEQRKRIIAILTQIRPWLETQAKAAASPPPQPRPVTPPKAAPSTEARAAPTANPPSRTATPPAKEGEEAATPQSIVAQIDSILQMQLVGTPLLEKGIRLQESPEGGVIVWVGITSYEGIEEVPDDQIKAAIRSAISAWEQKYTPGL